MKEQPSSVDTSQQGLSRLHQILHCRWFDQHCKIIRPRRWDSISIAGHQDNRKVRATQFDQGYQFGSRHHWLPHVGQQKVRKVFNCRLKTLLTMAGCCNAIPLVLLHPTEGLRDQMAPSTCWWADGAGFRFAPEADGSSLITPPAARLRPRPGRPGRGSSDSRRRSSVRDEGGRALRLGREWTGSAGTGRGL